MEREEIIRIVQSEIMTASEVVEYLETTKQNLASLIKRDKLIPIKEHGNVRLFLRQDVEDRKQDAELLRDKYRPYDS